MLVGYKACNVINHKRKIILNHFCITSRNLLAHIRCRVLKPNVAHSFLIINIVNSSHALKCLFLTWWSIILVNQINSMSELEILLTMLNLQTDLQSLFISSIFQLASMPCWQSVAYGYCGSIMVHSTQHSYHIGRNTMLKSSLFKCIWLRVRLSVGVTNLQLLKYR